MENWSSICDQERTAVLLLADMLSELTKREKEAGIRPEADVDIYLKVGFDFLSLFARNCIRI